jgi:MoaA/NifB/PqqE/SkfB family radical SAM enzyme
MTNFGWIGTWAITRRCNLNCTYCPPRRLSAAENEGIDYDRAVTRIGKIAPKVLNLTGGEPSLVEDLPRILETIKRQWDPFIRVVNNGTITHRLVKSLPHFDRLVVSLDGPGEVNSETRGISGDHVLNELRRFIRETEESENTLPEIVINNVVTTRNVPHLRRLCEAVAAVDERIEVAVSALVPTDHPLAIHMHPEVREDFWRTYHTLREEGFRLWHHFEFFLSDSPVREVRCYNQFFVVRFWPDGTPRTCTPETRSTVKHAQSYVARFCQDPHLWRRGFAHGARLIRESFRRGVDPVCHTPCNCEAWLDMLFTGGEHANLDYYFRPLIGRFTREEVERAYAFVRKYVNPGFPKEKLDPLVRQ